MILRKKISIICCFVITLSGFIFTPRLYSQGAEDILIWKEPLNLSRSPDAVSTDPFVLGDPTGKAHVFWVEKTGPALDNVPDTIMYSVWDGRSWLKPIDIFYAPLDYTMHSIGLQAVLDDEGFIHLIWMSEASFPSYTLFYSSAHSSEAWNAGSWIEPVALAADLTGTNFAATIAKNDSGHFHILYARVQQGYSPPENRAVTYIRSEDGGVTWTSPIDLYTIPDLDSGASNTRLLIDGTDWVYGSWSEWDETGNGQRIYFIRSRDGGSNWDTPVLLARRVGNEYERDLNNLVKLDDNKIAAVWEGGFRAYRQAMYSDDNGETWSEPVEIFPGLIGDNGYAMLVQDSLGRIHLIHAQRIREGNPRGHSGADGSALWHSMWDGNSLWYKPYVITDLNATIVWADIVAGNQIVVAWVTNDDYEIRVIVGEVLDAPSILQPPWAIKPISDNGISDPQIMLSEIEEIAGLDKDDPVQDFTLMNGQHTSVGNAVVLGIIPSLLFLFVVTMGFVYQKFRHHVKN
jgi:hypothetical protein